MSSSLLVDYGALSCDCADHALEFLHKAQADPPDGDAWLPHHDPLIRGTIEAFTARGLARLKAIRGGLVAAFRQASALNKAGEWSLDEVALTRAMEQIRGKHPRAFTIDDWMTYIDWLLWRNLPPGTINSEADYLAVRADVAAQITAAIPGGRPAPDIDVRLPVSTAALEAHIVISAAHRAAIDIARARAAAAIDNIGEQTRYRMRRLVIDHVQAHARGEPQATVKRLESQLFDEFAVLNRDWRRIAITEAGNAMGEGVIGSLPAGATVRRFEAYKGACPFCASINGKVFTVVEASKDDKDGAAEVWVGKTNIGRSASPRKRVGDELVDRLPAEMWWAAAGVQHPNCRGGWTVVNAAPVPRDPRTDDWIRSLLTKHGLDEPKESDRLAGNAKSS